LELSFFSVCVFSVFMSSSSLSFCLYVYISMATLFSLVFGSSCHVFIIALQKLRFMSFFFLFVFSTYLHPYLFIFYPSVPRCQPCLTHLWKLLSHIHYRAAETQVSELSFSLSLSLLHLYVFCSLCIYVYPKQPCSPSSLAAPVTYSLWHCRNSGFRAHFFLSFSVFSIFIYLSFLFLSIYTFMTTLFSLVFGSSCHIFIIVLQKLRFMSSVFLSVCVFSVFMSLSSLSFFLSLCISVATLF
jgi:hypothetical protein